MAGGGGGGGGADGADELDTAGALLASSPFGGALPAIARSSRRDVAASSLSDYMRSQTFQRLAPELPLYNRCQRMQPSLRHREVMF